MIRSFLLASLLLLTSCQYSFLKLEFERGVRALSKNEYSKATKHFYRVMVRDPDSPLALESSRKASRVSFYETKNYSRALNFYEHMVLYSKKSLERKEAQKQIASIYFDKLSDYKAAILEYNRLLQLENTIEEKFLYKFAIAKSYFYLNNFFQAQVEIEELLKLKLSESRVFELKTFLGNVFFNTKKMKKAIAVYKELMKDSPERSETENIAMNIVVCYEELKQFDDAIRVLQKIRETYNTPEFIDLKIVQLKKRKANLPGYKGLKK